MTKRLEFAYNIIGETERVERVVEDMTAMGAEFFEIGRRRIFPVPLEPQRSLAILIVPGPEEKRDEP